MSDHINDAFDILKHVTVPEAHDAKALGFKPPCPLIIIDDAGVGVVLPTIKLNDEPAFVAGEINNEAGYRNLAAEMSSFLLEDTQLIPELLFGIGGIAA